MELGLSRGWWLRRHLLEYHHARGLDDLAGVLLERDQLAQREGVPRHAEGGQGQLRRMVHLRRAELQARSLRVAGAITWDLGLQAGSLRVAGLLRRMVHLVHPLCVLVGTEGHGRVL